MQSPIRAQRRAREQKTTRWAGLGGGEEGGMPSGLAGRCETGEGGPWTCEGMESRQCSDRVGMGSDNQGGVAGRAVRLLRDDGAR